MEEGAATGGAAVTVDRTEEAMVGEATGAALSERERPYPLGVAWRALPLRPGSF